MSLVNLRALTAAAGISVALSACSDKGNPTTEPTTVANPNTLNIGMVLSLSGASATGDEAKRGAEVAVSQLNALGGVLGKRINLVVVDDSSDEKIARAKVDELLARGVTLGIGPTTNAAAVAIKDLVKADKVLYISPSATSPVLDNLEPGDSGITTPPVSAEDEGRLPVFFRTAATDLFLATAIAQYASQLVQNEVRCRNIVLVAQGDDYGTPIANFVEDRYRKLSLGIKRRLQLDPNVDNAGKLDDAARTSAETTDAQCQIVIAQPQVAGAYMRAFRKYQLINPKQRDFAAFLTIGSDGLRQNQFISAGRTDPADTKSATAGEGGFTLAADTAPEPEFSTQEFSAFLNLYKARYPGTDTGRYASTAYDAILLLAGAIERAQSSTDLLKIRQSLFRISKGSVRVGPNRITDYFELLRRGEDINYEGASGPCDFLSNGSVRSDFAAWQIVNAVFERKATFPASVLSGGSGGL